MIVKQPQFERALDEAVPKWIVALAYGPDEAGSRGLVDRFSAKMGADAERIDLDGAVLREDPARLPDEANALTMFGGPRWIRVTAGDEAIKAVEALLDAPKGSPVIIAAGNLPKTSSLVKLATSDARVVACQSWKPEGARADDLALQLGRAMGVRLVPAAARLLAEASGGDRAVMERELEKLALYVDAAPDRPRVVEREDVDAIGAAIDVRESWDLVDALFDGHTGTLASEISGEAAVDMIPALRAVERRALTLARQLAMRKGAAGPRVFNSREREAIERQSRQWNASDLAKLHNRVMLAESAIKRAASAGEVIAQSEILTLGRIAERRK